jgi:hypothetical protein
MPSWSIDLYHFRQEYDLEAETGHEAIQLHWHLGDWVDYYHIAITPAIANEQCVGGDGKLHTRIYAIRDSGIGIGVRPFGHL